MPSWKKVIVSGSDASVRTLFAANSVTSSIFSGSQYIGASFTGSLLGTASFAATSSRAITSSFALTSSFISTTGTNAFVQGGNSFGTTATIGTNDAQSLALESNGTTRVTLDSSGNTNIATGYQFSSAGTLNWGTSGYTIGQLSWDAAGGANNYAAVYGQSPYNLRLGITTFPTAIFITSSNGNVGINNTSPGFPLSLNSSLGNKIALYDAGAGSQYGFGIQSSILQIFANAVTDRVGIGYGNSTSFTETLTIKGSNVGVGITSPFYKLQVDGIIGFSSASINTPFAERLQGYHRIYDPGGYVAMYIGDSDPSNYYDNTYHYIRSKGGGTYYLSANSTGVGIGNSSPSYKLDITGGSVGTTAGNQSLVERLYSSTSNNEYLEITNTRAADGSTWETAGFRIQQKVDSTWMGYIQFNGNANNGGISIGTGTTTTSAISVPEALTINNSRNVGIRNVNPTTAKLVIGGTAAEEGLDLATADQYANLRVLRNSLSSIDKDMYIGYQSGASSKLHLYSNNSETVTVSGANVGINNTTPSYTLDITGAGSIIRANSSLSYVDLALTNTSTTSYIQASANNLHFYVAGGSSGDIVLSLDGTNNRAGINNSSPAYALDVTGTVATDYSIVDTTAPYRIIKPRNGVYVTQTSVVTGAIKITYPVGYTNTMHTVKARVYNYNANTSFTVTFGGYNYTGDPTPYWVNTFAYIEGESGVDRNYTVRFGFDGSVMTVYIGELASTWDYPQVFIEEVGLGFSGVSSTWANTSWTVGFESSAFANVTSTITNTNAHNFARNGTDAYYTIGNVGIGLTSPSYRLHVSGGNSFLTGIVAGIDSTYGEPYRVLGFNSISNGGNRILASSTTSDGMYFMASTGNGFKFRPNGGTSDLVTIDSTGKMGLGTTAPTYTLDVAGSAGIYDEAQDIDSRYYGGTFLRGWNSFATGNESNMTYTTDATSPLGIEVISISSYVWGRGPKIRLDKTQNYEVEFWIKRETANTAGTVYMVVSNYDSSGNVLSGDGTDWNYPMSVDQSTLTVGTWYKYRFVVGPYGAGAGQKDHSSSARYISVGFIANYTTGTDVLYFTGFKCRPIPRYNNDALTIQNNGNVAIKTTAASYALDVLGTIRATGDVIAYSDSRVKNNVQPITNALQKVISLRGVSYTRKDMDDKSTKIGVIAQEVLPVLPEVVSKDDNGNYSVSYGNMVGLLIEAIKEQQKEIDELKYLLKDKKNKK